jgi:two-component system sensor histidine kinase ChvG
LSGHFRHSSRQDEIGELSRALEVLSRRLGERLNAIESFASDVAHELRNPLASLRTATEMLSEARDREDTQRLLHQALSEIARLERLLSDLLDMARMDAHLESESREPVALDALLADLAQGFDQRSPSGVSVKALPAPELVVQASKDRLAQVLENLLDNALSVAPRGTDVTLTLRRQDDMAVIEVRDQGPGIPPADREKVFRRFFSVRPEGEKRHTGLGLSIARSIVEVYGGTLRVADTAGPGTVLEVRLPISPDHS